MISGHVFTEHFVCGHFRYRPPILPDESALIMGLLLRKGKVDDVSDHLFEHYIVLKDKWGQY